MDKTTRTLVIIVVIVVVLLIGFGIYAYIQGSKQVAPPVVLPPTTTTTDNIFTVLSDLISKIFGKKTLPPYVQVPPIDENGCDANGFNKIGISCSIGGW